MSVRDLSRHFFSASVAGLIFGGIAGLVAGLLLVASVDQTNHDYVERKSSIRAQCLAGNDRACRVYEVDYARGVL